MRSFSDLVVRRRPLDDGVVCLSLDGEVDLANASDLRAHLKAVAQNNANLVVDMSKLRHIDSSGIKAILDAHQTFGQVKRRMVLAATTPTVQKTLTILSVDRIVPVFATVEAALSDLVGHA